METTLTALERWTLEALIESSRGNGHDFGFTDDALATMKKADPNLSAQAFGGAFSSLMKKGIVAGFEEHRVNAVRNHRGRLVEGDLVKQFWFSAEFKATLIDDERTSTLLK